MNTDTQPPLQIDILPEGVEQLGYGESYKETLGDLLEQVQMFSHSTRQDIELIARYVHAFHAPAGTRIIEEGQREKLMWFLVEGKLDVFKEGDVDTQKKLVTIRAGKAVGEMSLIDELPHSATVVAATDCTLLLLTKTSFLRLAKEHPRLGLHITWKIAQLLSHRLRQTSGILVDHL